MLTGKKIIPLQLHFVNHSYGGLAPFQLGINNYFVR